MRSGCDVGVNGHGMRTPVDQAQLFFSRAVELEKRAADKGEGKLKETLLTLAVYYRELSVQAHQQVKHSQLAMQPKSETAITRQVLARQSRSSARLRPDTLSR
jgi:hypothetical protein